MNGMRLHERYQPEARSAQTIERAINDAIIDANEEDEDLTTLEIVRILHNVTSRWIMYALREERHPDDPTKKADEA